MDEEVRGAWRCEISRHLLRCQKIDDVGYGVEVEALGIKAFMVVLISSMKVWNRIAYVSTTENAETVFLFVQCGMHSLNGNLIAIRRESSPPRRDRSSRLDIRVCFGQGFSILSRPVGVLAFTPEAVCFEQIFSWRCLLPPSD